MMFEKDWYKSKGVLGGAVAAIAGVAGVMGYTIDESSQATIVELLVSIVAAAGGLLAAYGRIKADAKIK